MIWLVMALVAWMVAAAAFALVLGAAAARASRVRHAQSSPERQLAAWALAG